jgi:hypothetical protein
MIETFSRWFENRREDLVEKGISFTISPPSHGLTNNSIHADVRSKRYEWTIQLWENGMCDCNFLDWDHVYAGVKSQTYEFKSELQLVAMLDSTFNIRPRS